MTEAINDGHLSAENNDTPVILFLYYQYCILFSQELSRNDEHIKFYLLGIWHMICLLDVLQNGWFLLGL